MRVTQIIDVQLQRNRDETIRKIEFIFNFKYFISEAIDHKQSLCWFNNYLIYTFAFGQNYSLTMVSILHEPMIRGKLSP